MPDAPKATKLKPREPETDVLARCREITSALDAALTELEREIFDTPIKG